jgi:hypothetical protein
MYSQCGKLGGTQLRQAVIGGVIQGYLCKIRVSMESVYSFGMAGDIFMIPSVTRSHTLPIYNGHS